MLTKTGFGITKDGEHASRYIMKNSFGMELEVSDFGALVLAIRVPDKNGMHSDVVLGFDTLEEYYDISTGFGAYIGRNGNRIEGACVTIDGVEYKLDANNNGNNLHSGNDRSHTKFYQAVTGESEEGSFVEFSRVSPHMEQGFPGNLEQKIRYTLTEKNELVMDYSQSSYGNHLCKGSVHLPVHETPVRYAPSELHFRMESIPNHIWQPSAYSSHEAFRTFPADFGCNA